MRLCVSQKGLKPSARKAVAKELIDIGGISGRNGCHLVGVVRGFVC